MKALWKLFELDHRSLALFRVLLGGTLLFDIIARAREIPTFYTDAGVLPRAPLIQQFTNEWYLSLHLLSGAAFVQYLLFSLAAIFALFFTLGYRTRLATLISWILLLSVQNRNPLILSSGDQFLHLLLFWSLFLPLGAAYSVDRALSGDDPAPEQATSSIASLAFILQICFVYWFAAVLKSDPVWWSEGSALYYALSIDNMRTGYGGLLLEFPTLIWFLSFASIGIETIGPALLFIPRISPLTRILVVFTFIVFHASMALFLILGTFPFVCIAAWSSLLPGQFWERVAAISRPERARRLQEQTVIYYDGECGFCRKMVQLIRVFLALEPIPVRPAQERPKIHDELKRHRSWIVATEDQGHLAKFDAFVYLCQLSPVTRLCAPLLKIRPVRWLGDVAYRLVASNRGRLGRVTALLRPERPPRRLSPALGTIVAIFLVYIFLWNLGTVTQGRVHAPDRTQWIGLMLGLDQYWGMFAPFPRREDGWYVIPGKLQDGTEVDIFRGGASVSLEKPESVAALYPNAYWQKYLENLWTVRSANARLYYGQYLCRTWNASHSEAKQLRTFDIVFMQEDTPPPGRPDPLPRKVVIWQHDCFK